MVGQLLQKHYDELYSAREQAKSYGKLDVFEKVVSGWYKALGGFYIGKSVKDVYSALPKALYESKLCTIAEVESVSLIKCESPPGLRWPQTVDIIVTEYDGGSWVQIESQTRLPNYFPGYNRQTVKKIITSLRNLVAESVAVEVHTI